MKLRINKIVLVLTTVFLVSMFLLPFSSIFSVEHNREGWKRLYLVEDWTTALFYLPLVILWTTLLIKNEVLKRPIFKWLLIMAACISCIPSFLSVTMLSQDYEPGWGVYLSLFLFPLVIAFVITWKVPAKNSG